jgi:Flp pilus assembly protein CpaB
MSSKLFATRQGTIFLGLIAAVIAFVALIVYLNQYRNSVNNNAMGTVLVATQVIEKGASGQVVASDGFEEVSHQYAESAIPSNALVDPAALNGLVALRKIYPGEKLTADAFGPATNSLAEQLSKNQRAVSVPLGTPQQVGGQIAAGSNVDVWVYLSDNKCTYELVHNAYVLSASGGDATLRADPRQAGRIVWGSNAGQLWLTLAATIATTNTAKPVCGPAGH